jgi:hypothetical protein
MLATGCIMSSGDGRCRGLSTNYVGQWRILRKQINFFKGLLNDT